jgi:recombinational DNA repair protein (RecF pathway)
VTAERYTAVFTGLLSVEKPGEYLYLRMSEDPLGRGGYTLQATRCTRDGRPARGCAGRSSSGISRKGAGVSCSILAGSCGACKVKARIVGGI